MGAFNGVIFDFNGTLFFDTPQHEMAWRQYAKELCGREVTDDEFRYCIHGRTNADILDYFLDKAMTLEEIEGHAEAKEAIYRRLCLQMSDKLHLAEGAEALFDALKERKIPMAIATSSGRSNTQFYIKRFNMWNWFNQSTFIYNDGSFRSKPYPDIYLRAAEAIGMKPSECVVFEDMPLGIQAARAAGIGKIIAVSSSLSSEFLSSVEGVDAVVADFRGIEPEALLDETGEF